MSVLGIDFGTSRIKAAYWDDERGEAVMLPLGKRGQLYVPSLFHVSKDGKIRFGDEAEQMLHHDPDGIVENLKLDLDKPIKYVPNGQKVRSADLMTLLFTRMIEYSARQVKSFGGKVPEKLVLTLPSRWDYEDIYTDALETAGHKGEKLFLREPEAAGWAWIAEEKPQAGEMLVVLDFGGGTVDWASLQVDETGRPKIIADLPPGGITAAGAHVDDGLFDEMMRRISQEQRGYVQTHVALIKEQIRQMKESQNGQETLSGGMNQSLEVMLGPGIFTFEREVFEEVVNREAVEQALDGIGGYVKKAVKIAGELHRKQVWCVLVGGTRQLAGLEEAVKAKAKEIGKAGGIELKFSELGQADFATVRGAVRRASPEQGKPKPQQIRVNEPLPTARTAGAYKRATSIISNTLSAFNASIVGASKPAANLVERINGIQIEMIFVQGGSFIMGSNDGRNDEKPVHQVTLDDFYIGKFPVTQAQWEAVMGNNPSHFRGENLPVESVSWYDVQEFMKKLNKKTGGNYRLPTEAEWEYAARGGAKSRGYKYAGSNNIDEVAWYRDNAGKTHEVGTKKPNELGIYDMSGNLWESCSDWEGDYLSGSQTNPTGPSSGPRRVLRGGSWNFYAESCRSASRMYDDPGYSDSDGGFRLVSQ
ncbi:protein of unknown function DUF323 [Chloroherpeton thalassium ATCC 35110]|uniref:Sulfatase-modifying factor enzyme-like domain-containing protein n=1 Tax=Chloroherpeton thalassium (strain ATCC 35110 / GB-78) TaxID=517418 RepID=B3QWN0_CHLT3|nr:SUMF1/EgtB/PvdO family nonheme iron enzyme [Chloroherpeton thalassium]ACF14790.1 protein of unknown function DUF323 [Chloroherpeton thalassium ATCC 35110]